MRSENLQQAIIHKEVVIIGNGPSGIALSYMLSGNLPYVTSTSHPDEMLAARLEAAEHRCLIDVDLDFLANGLEGRSTNPVSLLMDALLHPCADIGMDEEALVQFKKTGKEIDHVVLGKGPPGGSWHKMDPQILTLSLGSWMSLPGLPFVSRDSSGKRAYASNVAEYYVKYVEQMNLSRYFENFVTVTNVKPVPIVRRASHSNVISSKNDKEDNMNWVKKLDENDESINNLLLCTELEGGKNNNNKLKKCMITNAFSYIWKRGSKKNYSNKCCKRLRDDINNGVLVEMNKDKEEIGYNENFRCLGENSRSETTAVDPRSSNNILCDTTNKAYCSSTIKQLQYTQNSIQVPSFYKITPCKYDNEHVNWTVRTEDVETGKSTTYSCKYLILANGCNDVPNKLGLMTSATSQEPDWLLYDLRTLEWCLDDRIEDARMNEMDPVLVVGSGLSAADAVIAVRGRNVPVIHAFRNRSADINRQLPEKMYPEYHKVHLMMQNSDKTYPLYSSYPEHTLVRINEKKHTVVLSTKEGREMELKVSYVIVLIGSRPDLDFLPTDIKMAVRGNNLPIDGKTNVVNIDKSTHRVKGYDNLYAVGTLAGDNFVRFITGGALAVVADLYKNEVEGT